MEDVCSRVCCASGVFRRVGEVGRFLVSRSSSPDSLSPCPILCLFPPFRARIFSPCVSSVSFHSLFFAVFFLPSSWAFSCSNISRPLSFSSFSFLSPRHPPYHLQSPCALSATTETRPLLRGYLSTLLESAKLFLFFAGFLISFAISSCSSFFFCFPSYCFGIFPHPNCLLRFFFSISRQRLFLSFLLVLSPAGDGSQEERMAREEAKFLLF